MFPLGIAIPLVLTLMGQRRAAIGWTAAIGCVWAILLVLKLAGYTIAAVFPDTLFSEVDLLTPSGHVASSASIYGSLIGLLLPRPGTLMHRSVLAATVVAVVIGTTRIALGVHSLAEVVVGGLVGVAGAAALAAIVQAAIVRRARLPLIASTLVIIATFHGDHTTWEETIRDTALRITQLWSAHS